jgi:hypothetical protein
MKRVGLGLVAALAWGGLAQAAQIKVELVQTLAAPVEYRDGMAGARSIRQRSVAGLMIVRGVVDEREGPILGIAVENQGQVAFNLTPQEVEVRTEAGVLVPLLTRDEFVGAAEELARKREKRARLAMALNSMGGAMRDQPQKADPSFARNLEREREEGAALVDAAQTRGFLAQTVDAGERHVTDLGLTALPKGTTGLTVTVNVGGETHTFPLRVTRYR